MRIADWGHRLRIALRASASDSIRGQLLAGVLVVTLPAVFVVGVLIVELRQQSRLTAGAEIRLLAANTAARLGAILREHEEFLEQVHERSHGAALGRHRCDPLLDDYARQRPELSSVEIFDPQGAWRCSAGPARPIVARHHDAWWFREGLASEEFRAGDAWLDAPSQRWVAPLTRHVHDAAQPVTGLVVAALDLQRLQRLLFDAREDGLVVQVLDRSGRVMMHSTNPQEWIGRPLEAIDARSARDHAGADFVTTGADGQRWLTAPVTMPLTDWQVIAAQPEQHVLAASQALGWRTAAALSLVLLIQLWLVKRLAARFGAPLQALRTSEERLRRALDASSLSLWDFDVSSGTVFLSESWSLLVGGPRATTQTSFAALATRVPQEQHPALAGALTAALKDPSAVYRVEHRVRRDDGSWFWNLSEGRVVERDADARALRMVGTNRDITERKQGEALLLGQRRVLEMIAAGEPLAQVLDTLVGVVEAQSTGAMLCSVLLFDAGGARLRHHAAPNLPPEVTQAVDAAEIGAPSVASRGAAPAGREPLIIEDIANDPRALPYREPALRHGLRAFGSTPIVDPKGRVLGSFAMFCRQPGRPTAQHLQLIGVAAQTAEMAIQHHDAQAALRANMSVLENTFEHMDQGISITDSDLRVAGTNRRFQELLDFPAPLCQPGTPFEALVRYNAERGDYGSGDVEEQVDARVALARRREPHRFERERPDGTVLEIRGKPIPDGGFVTTYTDITQRARSERELLRFRAALDLCSDGIFLMDTESLAVVDCNDGACRSLGYARDELLGLAGNRILVDRTPEQLREEYAGLMPGDAGSATFEALHRRKDGSVFPVEINRRLLQVAQGAIVVAVARNIVERRVAETQRGALEAQLRESQKMHAIGTLAGGIAHDFNNLLGAILGNTALARDELGAAHPAALSLAQVHRAGSRARDLVQQILAFSRRQEQQLVVRALRPLIEETLALLRATLPAGVAMQVRLTDEPLHVLADSTQLQQVLMNLCTNAWHALPGGQGCISVGLEAVPPDAAGAPAPEGLASGRCAHVWVRDDGSGMDEATRARIFEPFFTTKPVGHGTGLGLSVVHGIVSAHRGAIRVDSEPGRGSTFHLYVPLVDAAEAESASGFGVLRPARGQGEHVLYVDDDEVMALMAERLLQRAGYRVTRCGDPQTALVAVAAQPDAFDVVVSDFNMPGMTGIDLAHAIRRIRPGLPVIIGSGLIDEAMRAGATGAGVRHFLRKENAYSELAPLVHLALTEANG